jgi:hypothetical protein
MRSFVQRPLVMLRMPRTYGYPGQSILPTSKVGMGCLRPLAAAPPRMPSCYGTPQSTQADNDAGVSSAWLVRHHEVRAIGA